MMEEKYVSRVLPSSLSAVLFRFLAFSDLIQYGSASTATMGEVIWYIRLNSDMYFRDNHSTTIDIECDAIEEIRFYALKKLKQTFIQQNGDRSIFQSGPVDNYMVVRWAIYDMMPSARHHSEQLRIRRVFRRPLPGRGFWSSPKACEFIHEIGCDGEKRGKYNNYIRDQIRRRSPSIGSVMSAWYFMPVFNHAFTLLVAASCSICLDYIGDMDRFYLCTACDIIVHRSDLIIHRPCLVTVCRKCRDEKSAAMVKAVHNGTQRPQAEFHCVIRNEGCSSYSHAGQGCECACHEADEYCEVVEYV